MTPPRVARPAERRRFVFRGLAVLLSLVPLIALEVGLRIAGRGQWNDAEDPYVGFVDVHRLFELNTVTSRFEIPVSRQTYFRPESFAATKGPREKRVFCLGGSTVQGRPYAVETSFTTWLELNLQAADPQRHWEVVNCGGVSYATYRLAPILDEILDHYQPDVIVLYTGHNEFLEERTYRSVQETPRWLAWVHGRLTYLRSYNAIRGAWISTRDGGNPGRRDRLSAEVDAMLDYRDGLEQYQRDVPLRQAIEQHFAFNVQRMVSRATRRGIPVILVNPGVNLKDSPPFKIQHTEGLTAADQAEFDQLWVAAQDTTSLSERVMALEQAVRLNPSHAGVHYQLGKCYEAQGRVEEARAELLRAKDEDICPLRILESMRPALRAAADQSQLASWLDAQQLFEQLSEQGLTGEPWFVDHVHPSIEGHQRLADLLLEHLVQRGLVEPGSDWRQRRQPLFASQMAHLDEAYFERARERLQGLRRWTQGRAFHVLPAPGDAE